MSDSLYPIFTLHTCRATALHLIPLLLSTTARMRLKKIHLPYIYYLQPRTQYCAIRQNTPSSPPSPPSLFLPSQLCVFSSHHHSFPPELISLLYELHLSTTSTSGVPLPRLPPSFTIISRLKRDKKYYRWEKARR